MSMQDPISDLLTRIRNAQQAKHKSVLVPAAKVKKSIVDVLVSEGFIKSYETETVDNHSYMRVFLKYHQGIGVIDKLQRASRPGLRLYKSKDELLAFSYEVIKSGIHGISQCLY